MADITAITAAVADLKATLVGYGTRIENVERIVGDLQTALAGYGARVERIDEGSHGGWGYGKRIEDIQTVALPALQAELDAIKAQLAPKA